MAFSFTNSKGDIYYLHSKKTQLKGGREQFIYFFAKTIKDEGALDVVPEGYMVSESKNGRSNNPSYTLAGEWLSRVG